MAATVASSAPFGFSNAPQLYKSPTPTPQPTGGGADGVIAAEVSVVVLVGVIFTCFGLAGIISCRFLEKNTFRVSSKRSRCLESLRDSHDLEHGTEASTNLDGEPCLRRHKNVLSASCLVYCFAFVLLRGIELLTMSRCSPVFWLFLEFPAIPEPWNSHASALQKVSARSFCFQCPQGIVNVGSVCRAQVRRGRESTGSGRPIKIRARLES